MKIDNPELGEPISGTLTNCTGLPEAGLVDDAVTLAKMASGTAGNLITYDASGNPAAVSTGTATHVLTSNGAGAAPTFQAPSSGAVLQVKSVTYSTQTSGATTFPLDNTIPQNTEGTELVTLSITPSNASNRLLIIANFIVHAGSVAGCGPALFQDSTANALSYAIQVIGAGYGAPATLVHEMAAGTTSATTFKIRVGTHNGTWYVNQTNSYTFGGSPKSVLTIFEIAA
jgi:hypothetical protein